MFVKKFEIGNYSFLSYGTGYKTWGVGLGHF